MPVICKNCGNENKDPGVDDLSTYACGKCAQHSLIRVSNEDDKTGKIVASGLFAAIGAGVGGPIGAVLGVLLGYALGDSVDKEMKK